MIRCVILCCLLMSCQSQSVPSTTAKPTERIGLLRMDLMQPVSTAPHVGTSDKIIDTWKLTPTKKVAIGQNIWLETVQSPEQALGSLVSEALQQAGSQCSIGNTLATALPKQPTIGWQKRTPGIERRVIVDLEVVVNRGYLEHLFSRFEAGKNHESLLSSAFDAEMLNLALVAAGLKPGKPARFVNEKREADFKPATGDVVKIYFDYMDDAGKQIVVPAQSWVLNAKTEKPLDADWVFAGSYRGEMETEYGWFITIKTPYFGANDGRVACLSNYGSALLDLPFESVDNDPQGDALGFKANTAVVPKLETKVRAILEAAPRK
jgi:hypothetical protein